MKQNSKIIISAAALTAIIAVTGIAASSYASDLDNGSNGLNIFGFKSENNQAIVDAIENNDYEAWKELIGDKGIGQEITAENFDRFVEMHDLIQSGDAEGAEAIREELGLKMPRKEGKGPALGGENREAMKEALENNDYEAWKELVSDRGIGQEITVENFDKFVEMHNLMQIDDKEGADAIRDELGLQVRKGRGDSACMRFSGSQE